VCGLNEARCLGNIAQGLAQLANTDGEHDLARRRLRPEGLQQRCFGQQLSRVFHQIAAEGEGLGPEGERLVAAPQAFVRKVEPQRQGREGSGGICISQRTTLEQKLKRN
jgi:hypothetical protein